MTKYQKYQKYINKVNEIYYLYPNAEFIKRFEKHSKSDVYQLQKMNTTSPIAKRYFSMMSDEGKMRVYQWRHIPKFFKEVSEIRSDKIDNILK
jgi:hypothetical protein